MTLDTSSSAPGATIKFGRASWWVLVIEGLALIALGLIAVLAPFIAALAVTAIVGWIYMFAGGIRVVSSITHRGPGFGWSLFVGCLALLAGLFLLLRPLAGLFSLTLVLGAFFFADGVMSFFLAMTAGRRAGRMVWLVVTGLADLILAAVVFFGLASGALWLLGLVVAANLVFAGAAVLTLGLAWRGRRPTETQPGR